MRRISPIGWVLIAVGVILVIVGIVYLTTAPPDLPSFFPGVVSHPLKNHVYKHKYTKRAFASFVLAAIGEERRGVRLAAFGYAMDQTQPEVDAQSSFGGLLRAPMKYVGEIAIGIHELALARLEVGFSELGLNEKIAKAHVYFSAIEVAVEEWHSSAETELRKSRFLATLGMTTK